MTDKSKTDHRPNFVIWPAAAAAGAIAVVFTVVLIIHCELFYQYLDSNAEKQLAAAESIKLTLTAIGFICLSFGLFTVCLLAAVLRELKKLNHHLEN